MTIKYVNILPNKYGAWLMSANSRTKSKVITAMYVMGLSFTSQYAFAAEETLTTAFSNQYMIRAGAYFVDSANTQFSVNSTSGPGLGTTLDFKKDLGGDERNTIPRIDAYYRFNNKHLINFTAFSFTRNGNRTLTGEINIGDDTFTVNETLKSEIKYTFYKVGYGYSFYRSPEVELRFTAGLNITKYDFTFEDESGVKSETAGVTVPLPVFGLRMGYLLSPKWSTQFSVEAFAINIDDKFKGSLLDFQINAEYRLFKNFALGAGIASLSNADVTSDDWRGTVGDRYAGFTAFGTLYF